MHVFWVNLTSRERLIFSVAAMLLPVLGYFTWWHSLSGRIESYRTEVSEKRELLTWMTGAAREIKAMQPAGQVAAPVEGGSMLTVIDATGKEYKLDAAMKRVEPTSNNGVRIWLEKAKFDDAVRWLDLLQQQHQIVVDDFKADRRDEAGYVDLRVTLAGTEE